jgi:hypothetical protein
MQQSTNHIQTPTYPKDRSLAAYKDWMTGLINRFTTNKTTLQFTETEWLENWKEYWAQLRKQNSHAKGNQPE